MIRHRSEGTGPEDVLGLGNRGSRPSSPCRSELVRTRAQQLQKFSASTESRAPQRGQSVMLELPLMAQVSRIIVRCEICRRLIAKQPNQLARVKQSFCSQRCLAEHKRTLRGSKSPSWRGGRAAHKGGYIRIKVGSQHPMAGSDGYVLEHRLVMARHLDRMLLPSEVVHHLNHQRDDNRIENLALFSSNSAHRLEHAKLLPARPPCWCGAKHDAKGLCSLHYSRWRRATAEASVNSRGRSFQ